MSQNHVLNSSTITQIRSVT